MVYIILACSSGSLLQAGVDLLRRLVEDFPGGDGVAARFAGVRTL